jgi:hypothetical protein
MKVHGSPPRHARPTIAEVATVTFGQRLNSMNHIDNELDAHEAEVSRG